MAIGTAAAIGLGVAGVGSVLSSSSANRAASRAADTSTQNNRENIALARDIYGQNRGLLNPFVQRGNVAGEQINALLGLGGSQVQGGPASVGPNALSQFQGYPGGAGAPYGLGDTPGYSYNGGRATGFASGVLNGAIDALGRNEGLYRTQGGALGATSAPTPTTQSLTPQQAASNAFDTFRNSTGYQFRLGEGLDAVNSAYAGIGGLQSGAALRGIAEYGQNFASNEFGNYLNALGAQQATGAGAASSLAGVGQNFAGTVIGANNLNAQNQINAQVSRGNNNVLGGALGLIGGGLFGFGG